MQEWLLISAHRADTAMPALLSIRTEQDAADLAAWVVSMGLGSRASHLRTVRRRQSLMAKLQCLNCHVLEPEDDYDGISLAGVSQKYQPAMADFPCTTRQITLPKMPDFRLSEQEAADLEAFGERPYPVRERA